MPAGVLRPAGLGRELELMFGDSLKVVLGREQEGAGAANDLGCLIQENPLRARIPGLHRAGKAEMKDGVVNRGLEKLLIMLVWNHAGTHLEVFPLEPDIIIRQPAGLERSGL